MSKAVTFYLGPTQDAISTRTLVITRMMKAGDDSVPSAAHDADAGNVDNVTVTLPDNQLYEAKLTDVIDSGEASAVAVLHFHTGSLQFPGPANRDDPRGFRILYMEDLSSSSSVSSSSVSSSSASSVSSASSGESSQSSSSQSSSSSSASSSSSHSSSSASSVSSLSSQSSSSSSSASSVSSSSSS